MQQTDVSAATVTATGTVVNQPARIKGVYIGASNVDGSVVFRNGGASGTELLRLNVPGHGAEVSILIPENGIRFTANIHATITSLASVTVFYG